MNLSISARINLGFALALAMLLALGIGSFRHTSSLREDFNWLQHTHRVLEENDKLAALLHQSESVALTKPVDMEIALAAACMALPMSAA